MIRMMAADALSERGIIAWEAGNAEEAMHVLKEHPHIGVVFTDVGLPGEMNGLDLAHEVRRAHPAMSVILTSGAGEMVNDDLPCDGTFLAKPYTLRNLLNLVVEKLDLKKPGNSGVDPTSP